MIETYKKGSEKMELSDNLYNVYDESILSDYNYNELNEKINSKQILR